MILRIISLIACVSCLFWLINPAISNSNKNNNIGFDLWTDKLKKDLSKKGYKSDFIEEIFSEVYYSKEHLEQDKKQFRPQTFTEYYENAVNYARIRKSKKQIKKNNELLNKVEAYFFVPKEYIISLWAMETDLGRITGDFNVINSLANLSYNKRRRKLFLGEFFAAIEVLKNNNIKIKDFKGSWAGAIGQCQFLPSTYLRHGFDFNKDDKADIWSDKEDVFASIASYLKSLGWNYEVPWGYEVKNLNGLSSLSSKRKYSLQHLVDKYDLEKMDGSKFFDYELSNKVKIINQEDRLFITFKNFDLIKRWNNSTYFALTVGLLADKIKK